MSNRENAQAVLSYYAEISGNQGDNTEERLTDLLTDLLHAYGSDLVRAAMGTARIHYVHESEEGS